MNLPPFLLAALASRSRPILITGEEGFPFHRFFRLGRERNIPLHSMKRLLVAQSVNMYHLRDIIRDSREWIGQGAFPVFRNLSGQYLDENVPFRVAQHVFFRDQEKIEELTKEATVPAFFVESQWEDPQSRKGFLQREIYNRANCVLEWSESPGGIPLVRKNILTEQERSALYGCTDSSIFNLSGRIVQGMERVSEFSPERRPSILR